MTLTRRLLHESNPAFTSAISSASFDSNFTSCSRLSLAQFTARPSIVFGTHIVFSGEHPANANSSIRRNLDGAANVSVVNARHSANALLSRTSIDSGKPSETSEVVVDHVNHPSWTAYSSDPLSQVRFVTLASERKLFPKVRTEPGKQIDVSDGHFDKESDPNHTCRSLWQALKQFLDRASTDAGSVIDRRAGDAVNTHSGIWRNCEGNSKVIAATEELASRFS
jgi:hypothetical protein